MPRRDLAVNETANCPGRFHVEQFAVPENPDEEQVKAVLEMLVVMPGERIERRDDMGFVCGLIFMPGHLEWFDDRPRNDFLFSHGVEV